MSIRLVTMDGGHVTPEIDSFLYRGLVPRIAPTSLAEDIPAFADYLLYGGQIVPMGVNVFIQKTVMLGCGRIIEIPDSETIQVPADASGKSTKYTLVFRIQPSVANASDRVKAFFVPENGTFYAHDISTGTGIYDVKFATVSVDETGFVTYAECILPKMPVHTNDASETKMEIDGQICVPTAEGVRKFVFAQNYFSKSSPQDKLWLLLLIAATIESEAFVTKDAATELDSLARAYSVYYPLDKDTNANLWNAFNGAANGAFVSAFRFDVENEVALTVQLALPVSGNINSQMPAIATRYKVAEAEWSTWNTSGTGAGGEIPSAENYSVINPISTEEKDQNLQQALFDIAQFSAVQALQTPQVMLENSAIIFKEGSGALITNYEEYPEGSAEGVQSIVVPCQEGEEISILFVGEAEYSRTLLDGLAALSYNFEVKRDSVYMDIDWSSVTKVKPTLTQDELNDGQSALTSIKFTVPTSDSDPINAITLVVRNDYANFDYSNLFYVAHGPIYAVRSNEVTGLKVKNSAYPICDSKARSITDRLFINDNGELFIDGKKYGNN